MRTLIASFLLAFFLASCAAPTVVPPTATLTPVTPTATLEPSPTATQPTATETPTPEPEKFDAATWSTMDATARQAEFDKLPATTAEGYTKGEVSAVKDYLQKYYDPKTKELVEVFDFETGKYETPEAAGIHEFDLTDGTKWEMRAFFPNIPEEATPEQIEAAQIKALEEMVNFMVKDGVAWGDINTNMPTDKVSLQALLDYRVKFNKIPGVKSIGAMPLPFDIAVPDQELFLIGYTSVPYQGSKASIVDYTSDKGGSFFIPVFVGIPADKLWPLFAANKVMIPARPQP